MAVLIARSAAEVSIVAPRERVNELVKAVLETGAFHPKLAEGEAGGERAALQRLISEADNLTQRIRRYLEYVGAPEEPGPAELQVRDWVEAARSVISEANELDSKLDPLLRKLTELETPGSELAEVAAAARAYRWLDFDLMRLRDTKHVRVRFFRVPKERIHLFEDLAREEPILVIVAEDYEPVYALAIVAYTPDYEKLVYGVVSEADALEIEIPSEVPQNLAKAAEYFDRLVEEARRELREAVPKLRELLAKLLTIREALRVLSAFTYTRLFAVIDGYVPLSKLDRFSKHIMKRTDGEALVYARGFLRVEEEVEAPSYIEVPRILKPFEMLMTSYGLPRPREFVPLLLMAITFPLIFGMAFPDAGHGLVLLLLGLYMARKGDFFGFAKGEGVRKLGNLLVFLGVSSIIFGFLAAEFFGPLTADWLVAFWCSLGFTKPPYATPLYAMHIRHLIETGAIREVCPAIMQHAGEAIVRNIMETAVYFSMYVALLLGTLLLTLSSLFGVYNYLVEGEKYEAIASGLSKTLVFGGVFIAFLAGLPYLPHDAIVVSARILGVVAGLKPASILEGAYATVIVPLVSIMVYGGLLLAFVGKIAEALAHGAGIAAGLGGAALELFDLLLLALGNTISFLRIFALALAHSGLMFGFAEMALMSGAAMPVVYILGNLVVIGMESLVAFAHTLRLHYYEMFGKFFSGAGKPFQPAKAYAKLL